MGTSRITRIGMRDWVLSQAGDKWSVKIDFRDLGGHLGTALRGWSATLAARVLFQRLLIVAVLPLYSYRRLRIVRTMFIPGALHGIEVSFVSPGGLLELRSALVAGVWFGKQPMAPGGFFSESAYGRERFDPGF